MDQDDVFFTQSGDDLDIPGNTKPFRFCAKSVFLTFPQSKLDRERIANHLEKIGASAVLCARELHTDGNQHFHCLAKFNAKINTKNPRYFDIEGEHPNIQSPRNLHNITTYITKSDPEPLNRGFPIKRKTWGDIRKEATSAEDYLNLVEQNHPRDAALAWERLHHYAKTRFPTISTYEPTYTTFTIPNQITDWVNTNLVRPRPERPKSLYLVGASRSGKTEWARSLGKHIYCCGAFNLENFQPCAEYMIFDDIAWEYVPSKKQWFGAQKEFVICDKYKKKTTIKWGNPTIYLCNHDFDIWHKELMMNEWWQKNVIYVNLTNKLY